MVTTPANVNDVTQTHACLHSEESNVFGDAGYQSVAQPPENQDRTVTWHVAMKRGTGRALLDAAWGWACKAMEQAKASIRAKAEHPIRIIKRQFGYLTARYRGLSESTAQLVTPLALANLFQMMHHRLMLIAEMRP